MSGSYDRKDHLYKKAKEEGFRSRASYKIVELNEKYRFIPRDGKVLDLGAWPGGWLQSLTQILGPRGKAVGIDLVAIDSLGDDRIKTITGDVRDDENIEEAIAFAEGKFDAVISDMSPKLSGIREVDSAAATGLAELALWVAGRVLRPGGALVIKVFKGNDTEVFYRGMRPQFEKVHRAELKSTRKTSNEFYLVGVGFKGMKI